MLLPGWSGRNGPRCPSRPPTPCTARLPRASRSSATTTGATWWLLVRHGETALSVDKRFSGSGDPELTDRGRAQAEAVAARLTGREVAAVVSSPRSRARATAAAIGAALDVAVTVDDGLAETDFGEWEGCTFAEIRERWPSEMAAWLGNPAEGEVSEGYKKLDLVTRMVQLMAPPASGWCRRTRARPSFSSRT